LQKRDKLAGIIYLCKNGYMHSTIPESSKKIEPVLQLFKSRVSDLYGKKLRGIILYGSYARGMAGINSDIDLLVILSEMDSAFKEIETLNEIKYQIGLENDRFISTNPVTETSFDHSEIPFFRNIMREGVIL
jgi:predicted nucleotidyltransferase